METFTVELHIADPTEAQGNHKNVVEYFTKRLLAACTLNCFDY